MKVSGLFGIGEHLKRLSETGDRLETLAQIIDFEAFRPVLDPGLGYLPERHQRRGARRRVRGAPMLGALRSRK